MNPPFEIGDSVVWIDEALSGVIRRITPTEIWVETTKGVEIPVKPKQLVKVIPEKKIRPSPKPSEKILPEKKETILSETEEKKDDFSWKNTKKIPKKKDPDFIVPIEKLEPTARVMKKKVNDLPLPQIDLHIHCLQKNYRHLNPGEIVEIQLTALQEFVDFCLQKRHRKFVIIHGIGTGKLRGEVLHYLERYSNLQVYDAPYKNYGRGASLVEAFYGKY